MEGLPELPVSKPCGPVCMCRKTPTNHEPDCRLLVWERNQSEGEKLRKRIAEQINRPQDMLLMNTVTHYRALEEHRLLLTYAQVPCEYDKYRGNPMFWRIPPKLHKIADEPQNYYLQMTRLERGEVPQLEYVTVPRAIAPQSQRHPPKHLTHCVDYCRKRLDACALAKLQPHKPELDDVLVVGQMLCMFNNKPEQDNDQEEILRRMVDEASSYVMEGMEPFVEKSAANCYLVINDQKILADTAGLVKASVIFNSTTANTTQMHYLHLENCSDVSMRVHFVERKKSKTMASTRVPTAAARRFFFDRNYRIVAPTGKCEVPFWFKSETCGFFDQLLEMHIVPDLWGGKLVIQVTLKASAADADSFGRLYEFETRIQTRVRNRLIAECMDHMLKGIPRKSSAVKLYTYDKAKIFEALNSRYDPLHSQPKYLYAKEIVDELEEFYQRVRLENIHPEAWSLSIEDLRAVTRDREHFEHTQQLVEQRDKVLELVAGSKLTRAETQKRLELLRRDEKSAEKKSGKAEKPAKAVKSPKSSAGGGSGKKGKDARVRMVERERQPLPRTLSEELNEIVDKLPRPMKISADHGELYKICYILLCAYVDQICEDALNLTALFAVERLERVPSQLFGESMKIDSIGCDLEQNALYSYLDLCNATPQPISIRDIPVEDHRARYQALQPDDKGKGKKQTKASTRSVKSTNTSVKDRRGRASKAGKGSIHSETIVEEEEEEEDVPMFVIPPANVESYRNNLYVIFYQRLGEFIDDIDVFLGTLHLAQALPGDALQRIYLSHLKQIREDDALQAECIDVRRTISEALKWDVPEERAEPPKRKSYRRKMDDDELVRQSSSVFDVMKAYLPKPKRAPVSAAEVDNEAVFPRTYQSTLPMVDMETDITPEEVITERQVQTSLCSDITVSLGTSMESDAKPPICVCPPVKEIALKMVNSFHDSQCYKSDDGQTSSDDGLSSLDTPRD